MSEIVSIHQPNYLPWIGYFHKILTADTFVFLDNVEFNTRSVIHRNKIKTRDGEHWLTVPIASSSSADIADLEIDTTQDWQQTHQQTLRHHYASAPRFEQQSDLLEIYEDREWAKLVPLNLEIIQTITEKLGLETEFVMASSLSVDASGQELMIDICNSVGADTYFSGTGAKEYQEYSQFKDSGIELVYQDITHPEYPQQFGEFVSHLSVVDLLFNVGADRAREILNSL